MWILGGYSASEVALSKMSMVFYLQTQETEKVFSGLNVCVLHQTEHSIHLGCSAKGVKNSDNLCILIYLCTDIIELGPWLQ